VCALVGAPTPREADKKGEWFTFEKGVEKGALAGRAQVNPAKPLPTTTTRGLPFGLLPDFALPFSMSGLLAIVGSPKWRAGS
jgi:hypothetical protein